MVKPSTGSCQQEHVGEAWVQTKLGFGSSVSCDRSTPIDSPQELQEPAGFFHRGGWWWLQPRKIISAICPPLGQLQSKGVRGRPT